MDNKPDYFITDAMRGFAVVFFGQMINLIKKENFSPTAALMIAFSDTKEALTLDDVELKEFQRILKEDWDNAPDLLLPKKKTDGAKENV